MRAMLPEMLSGQPLIVTMTASPMRRSLSVVQILTIRIPMAMDSWMVSQRCEGCSTRSYRPGEHRVVRGGTILDHVDLEEVYQRFDQVARGGQIPLHVTAEIPRHLRHVEIGKAVIGEDRGKRVGERRRAQPPVQPVPRPPCPRIGPDIRSSRKRRPRPRIPAPSVHRLNHRAAGMDEYVRMAERGITPWDQIPTLPDGLRGLEKTRKLDLEDWLDTLKLDAVLFPTNADVGPADADINPESADIAWSNGIWVANGNLAIRHLGVPTVTVPMGIMADIGMPVGLTFAGRAYDDSALLQFAAAFESTGSKRLIPPRTPALSDVK